mgnify:CR=1 FL=1|tara:strand:+ start:1747 stop:2154 length:408 start_codon:yes stop_codon:yes gene_type:complete
MAATTHRGITYTSSGSATLQVQLDLPLQAGVDQDETTWLTSYPGALTSFAARQTDGANRMQPRLVCLGVGALAEAETITLSGDCNVIISAIAHGTDATANLGVTSSGLILTADCELSSDGTTDDTSNAVIWIIVG